MQLRKVRFYAWLLLILGCSSAAFAQFTSSLQGTVQDTSGAAIAKANIQLVNDATSATVATTADAAGNYRFVDLAPGAYTLKVSANGFTRTDTHITLLTEQNLNLPPVQMKVGGATESVTVNTEAPVLDTADNRNEMTLENSGVAQLPVAGRNMVTLTTLAPGVNGLGTLGGGQPGHAGTPGSGVDNYSTETQVDASANGQGQMSNMYVVDGLDVTSGIRQGVLNLTPNPESIQETSIQVNTFSSEYSRASGVEEVMTTKSGSDRFHGSAADWYDTEQMFARTHFSGPKYLPFHGNNMSFAAGGPIIPHKQLYFFFAIEPLRSVAAANNGVTFTDPQFAAWAKTAYPNSVGTSILNKYVPTHVNSVAVSKTANDIFPGTCGTAATNNLPCATPMVDTASFSSSQIRNGTQYFGRIDKQFKNDMVYGSIYRTLLTNGGASPFAAFSTLNNTWEYAFQGNEEHTFGSGLINQAMFGASRVEGVLGSGAQDYTVPSITVTGGVGFGVGFAQGDFIQHNYHWRDVLSKVRGAHTLRFGYEGWYGDDVEPFQGPYSQPAFNFDNLLQLAQDAPRSEGNVMYNPITGVPQLWSWDAASSTWGLFAEDTWKANRNLTLTLGLRWDDSGNPWSKSTSTVFGNFYLGPGQTFQQQVANGFTKATNNALNHAVTNLLSPRIGYAWDVTGKGRTVLHGGFGIYNDWLTQANVQEEFRGSPPGEIQPTFTAGTATPPKFVLGTTNKPPFGFTYPALVGSPLCPALGANGCLDSQGGIVGANFGIGAINPNLLSPKANIWSATLEQKVGQYFAASAGYAGSHTYNLVGGNDIAGIVSYGQDINALPGDLFTRASPQHLNTSFGSIAYANNDRYANYESVFFDFKGRFGHTGFVDASYTRAESKDDAGDYPAEVTPAARYGPSPWDVPNRFSLTFNYQVPGLANGNGAADLLTSGWGISGTSIYQTGYPVTVGTTANFAPICKDGTNPAVTHVWCTATNPAVSYAAGSGNYTADGDTNIDGGGPLDYPNVSSYNEGNTKSAYLNGAFSANQFTLPTFGSLGNENPMQFREPNFIETDTSFYKTTKLREGVDFQVRFEFFDLFNRVNLAGFDANLADANFGKATAQQLPRNWQIAGRFTF